MTKECANDEFLNLQRGTLLRIWNFLGLWSFGIRHFPLRIFILFLSFLSMTASAETNSAVKLPPKQKLKIYLLMGQSNMAGRGEVEEPDKTPHPRVLAFNRSNEWELAVEPVNRGEPKKNPGVGPGLAFGKAMAEANPDMTIGLVPCALGGTPLKRWESGADLYSNAVARAKAASEFGEISGILWHQGEGDSLAKTDAETYGERLAKMIGDIRADLKQPHLPFIVGQIGEFNYDRAGNPLPFARDVNEALANLPNKVQFTSCVMSKGLGHKGDELHFSSEAQRELGKRYAKEMLKVEARLRKAQSDRKLFR